MIDWIQKAIFQSIADALLSYNSTVTSNNSLSSGEYAFPKPHWHDGLSLCDDVIVDSCRLSKIECYD